MSVGRDAARTAKRREREALAQADDLRRQLQAELGRHAAEIEDLNVEIRRLRAEHVREAGVIVEREVERLMALAAKEREARGLSDERVRGIVGRKERLILNACRYLSMTKGITPIEAVSYVVTWATGKDFIGVVDGDVGRFCTNVLDCFPNGWVSLQLLSAKPARVHRPSDLKGERFKQRLVREGLESPAISLDHAEEREHEDICAEYDPTWYKGIEDLAVVGEEATPLDLSISAKRGPQDTSGYKSPTARQERRLASGAERRVRRLADKIAPVGESPE
jgi:hypothetical protein